MPNYVKRRTYETSTKWYREFARAGAKDACLAFESDRDGTPLSEAKRARVAELALDPAYEDWGVDEQSWSYADPAVIRCDCCTHHVALYGFTNTCSSCGADYNMSGDMLASRSQWGEETGEDLGEILRIR